MRFLVVDDEPALLRMMTLYLTRMGYEVTTADGGERGWAVFSASPSDFALVVLDGTMAGKPVDELAMRMLNANLVLRVIVTSGYPVDMSGLLATAPDRAMFVQKPFTSEMLAAAVRRMLGEEEAV